MSVNLASDPHPTLVRSLWSDEECEGCVGQPLLQGRDRPGVELCGEAAPVIAEACSVGHASPGRARLIGGSHGNLDRNVDCVAPAPVVAPGSDNSRSGQQRMRFRAE